MTKAELTTIISAVALGAPATSAAYEADATAKLEVAFTGIEVRKGGVIFDMYDSEDDDFSS